MRVKITARHCEVPDTVREHTLEVIAKLTKFDPRVSSAEVVFHEEKHSKHVECILSIDREKPLVARGEDAEFRPAVDRMVDRLGRRLRRNRAQRVDHKAPKLGEVESAASD